MVIVVLTGSIAMGKSTAGTMLRRRRVPVFDAELFCRLLYDWRDFRVVNVADLREEVMLNLVVESATEEGQQARLHTEIRSGVDLVG